MLKSNQANLSSSGKKLILIVDDEAVDRELLGAVLESDYDLLFAADGQAALEQIRAQRDNLSLILLDLQMPIVSCREVLRVIREESELRRIPVIVLTGDQASEVECLELGAADFIPKPYPQPGIILARVRRTIELNEDREIIRSTECDPLTGLFNRENSYRYATEFDHHNHDVEMDADELDVNRFHKINERFGITCGDEVLSRIDEELQDEETKKRRPGIRLRTAAIVFALIALLIAIALFVADAAVARGYRRIELASDRYISAQLAASDMETGSDYLTDRVHSFVATGEQGYLDDFFEEVKVTRRRDLAVEKLAELLEGRDTEALEQLNTALTLSNELVEVEYHAMRLMLEAGEYDMNTIPEEIAGIALSAEESALSPDELRERAKTLVFGGNYVQYKERIRENVTLCTQSLIRSYGRELEEASNRIDVLFRIQTAATLIFLLSVLAIMAFINSQIRYPLSRMVDLMQEQKTIPPDGVEELRFAARTYNTILRENIAAREKLSHEASHDALTGLLNRGAYELLMDTVDREHIALLLIDVDNFKQVNDTYGHAMGDRVLKRVAEILQSSFRSVDIICRIGGDEFVVVMTRVNSAMRQLVYNKIERANDLLRHPKDDLAPVSLSVGVAFSDRENPQGDIFSDADAAAYRVKRAGGGGCAFFE